MPLSISRRDPRRAPATEIGRRVGGDDEAGEQGEGAE